MLVLLATVGVLLYASFLLRPSNVGDLLPWLIVVGCESVMMFQVVVSLWTQLSSAHEPREFEFHEARRHLSLPTVLDLDAPLEPTDDMQRRGSPRSALT